MEKAAKERSPLAFARVLLLFLIAVMLLLILAALLWISHGSGIKDRPIVRTPLGDVEGLRYKDANVFLGLRYANADRFMRPEPVKPWNGTYIASSYGLACYAYVSYMPMNDLMDDDCLFVNIFAPNATSTDPEGYPVLVFVHGGGFEFGSASHYSYKVIVDNFVSRGIVFATFNYRVGPFGFFSTGDSAAPGNNGLWDQAAALGFLKRVISSFGGNSKKTTVAGQSAGSMSLSALSVSSYSSGLFDQAIMMSGSLFSPALFSDQVVKQSLNLAKAVGCNEDAESSVVLKCVKSVPIMTFYNVLKDLLPITDEIMGIRFHPRIDGELLSESLKSLLLKAPIKPAIMGFTDMEGGLFTMANDDSMPIAIPESNRSDFNAQQFESILQRFFGTSPKLYELLKQHYVDRPNPETSKTTRDSAFFLTRLTDLAGDLMFVVPILQEAQIRREAEWSVYLYLERDIDVKHEGLPIVGTFHNTELKHLFKGAVKSDFDRALIEGFVSFVKNGNPTINGTSWLPTSTSYPGRHFVFGSKLYLSDHQLMKGTNDLWLHQIPANVNKSAYSISMPLI